MSFKIAKKNSYNHVFDQSSKIPDLVPNLKFHYILFHRVHRRLLRVVHSVYAKYRRFSIKKPIYDILAGGNNMIKLLIVDDDIGICKVLQDFFEIKGYKTFIALRGQKALDLIEKEKPHLVFLDIGLPDISGLEVLQEIRKRDAAVKIIMITAYDEEDKMRDAEKNGASDYIIKPFSLEYLNEITLRKVYKQLFDDLRLKHSKLISTFEQIVFTLAKTLEKKDLYTRGHSERVSQYSVDIAKELNLSENEVIIMSQAALLHDIGKIGIKDNILNKRAPLLEEEMNEIKRHTTTGFNLLQIIKSFREHAIIIKHHHERIDGNGYPENKKNEEIPFLSKILAIADSYDAMTSDRAYRKRLLPIEAIKRLIMGKGTQFDTMLVNVFVNTLIKKQVVTPDDIKRLIYNDLIIQSLYYNQANG